MSRRYQGTTTTSSSFNNYHSKSSLSVSALLQTPWIEPLVYDTLIQQHHHHSHHLHEDQHAHEDEEQQQHSPKIVQVLAINKIKMNLNHHDNNNNTDNTENSIDTTIIDVPYTIHITDGTTSIIAYLSDTVRQQQDDVHDGEDRPIQNPTTTATHMNRYYLNDIFPGTFIRIENWEIIISYYNTTTTTSHHNETSSNLYTNQLFQTYATIHEKNIIIPSFTSLFQSITTTTTTIGEGECEGEGEGVGVGGDDQRTTNIMNSTNSEDNRPQQQQQQQQERQRNKSSNSTTRNKIRAIYIQLNQPYVVIGNCSTILNHHHHQHHNNSNNIVPVIDAIDIRRAIRSIEQQQQQQHEKSSNSTSSSTRASRINTNNIIDRRRRIPTPNTNNKTTTTTASAPNITNTNTNISLGNIQQLFDSTSNNDNSINNNNNTHEEQFWSYISSIPNNDSNNDSNNDNGNITTTNTTTNTNRNIQQLLDSNDNDRNTHQNDFWSYISSIPNNTSNNNDDRNDNNDNLRDDSVMEMTDLQSQISTTKDDSIIPTTTKPLSQHGVMISDTDVLHNELPIVQLNEQQYDEQYMNVTNSTNEITIIENNIIMNHDMDDRRVTNTNTNNNKYGDNEISNAIVNIDDDDDKEQIGMSEMLIDDEESDDSNDDGDDDEDVVAVEGGGNDIDESNNDNNNEEHVSETPEEHVSETPELLLPIPESSNKAMDDDEDTTTKDLVNTDVSTQPTGTILPITFNVGSQSNNMNNNKETTNDENDNKDNDGTKTGMDRNNELSDDEGQEKNRAVEEGSNTIDTVDADAKHVSETPDISTEEPIEVSDVLDHDEATSTTDLVNTEGSTQHETQEFLTKEPATRNRVMDHKDTSSAADLVNTDNSTQYSTFDVDTENNIMNDTKESNDDNDDDGRRITMNRMNFELQVDEGEENINAVENENDEIINDDDEENVSETQEFLTKESATRNEVMDHDNITTTEFVNTDASTQHTTVRNTFDDNIQNNDMNNHRDTNDDNNDDEALVGIHPARIRLSEGEGDEDYQFVEQEGNIAVEEENNEISIDTDDEYISETQDITMKEAANRTVVYGVTSSTDIANTEVSSQQIILPNTLDMDTQFNTNTINNSDTNDENDDKGAQIGINQILVEIPEEDGEENADVVEEETDEICNNFEGEHASETQELSANKTAVSNGTLHHDDTRTIIAPTTNEIDHSINDAIDPKMGSDIPVMDTHSSTTVNDNVLNNNEVQKVNNDVPIDNDKNVDDDNDDDVVLETQQCFNKRDDSDTLSYKDDTTPFFQTQSLIYEKENKQCCSNGTVKDNDYVEAHNSQVKVIDTYTFETQRIEPLLSNGHPDQNDGDGDGDDEDDVEFLETQLPLDMNVRKEIVDNLETQRLLSDMDQCIGNDAHGDPNEGTDIGNDVNNIIISGIDTTDSAPVTVEALNDTSVNDFADIQTTHEKYQEEKILDNSMQTDSDQHRTTMDAITCPDISPNEIVLETQDQNDGTYLESRNTNISEMLTSESNKRQQQNQNSNIDVDMDRLHSTAVSTIPKNTEAKDNVTDGDKSTVGQMPIVDTRTKKRRKKEFQFGGDVFRSLIFDRR